MAKNEARKSLFSVYYQSADDEADRVHQFQLVTRCDSVDVAIGVALNLHQLSNCPHEIVVEDEREDSYLHLRRYGFSELKFRSDAR